MSKRCEPSRGTRFILSLAIGLSLVGMTTSAAAQVPQKLRHQGRLMNDAGEPVTGEKRVTFTLYDSETGGAVLWQAEKQVEFDESGFYAITLGGDSNPIEPETLEGGDVYLSIQVGDNPEMTPRHALHTAPFSVIAERARDVTEGSIESSDLSDDFSLGSDRLEETTLGDVNCPDGQVPIAQSNGQYACDQAVPVQQKCAQDEVAVGLDDQGELLCRDETTRTESEVERAVQGDFAASDQACGPNEVVRGLDQQGTLICETDQTRSESEVERAVQGDFAAAGQSCPSGQVVAGLADDGSVICRDDKDTNTDTQLSESEVEQFAQGDFAASGQNCQPGQVVAGIADDGTVVCRDDQDTDTQLSDSEVKQAAQGAFADADQDCQTGQVVTSIDSNGNIECQTPQTPELLDIKRTKNCLYTEGKSTGWYSGGREMTVTTTRQNATLKVDYRDRVHCDDTDGGGDWCTVQGRLVVDGQSQGIVFSRYYQNHDTRGCDSAYDNQGYEGGSLGTPTSRVNETYYVEGLNPGQHTIRIEWRVYNNNDELLIGGKVSGNASNHQPEARLAAWQL